MNRLSPQIPTVLGRFNWDTSQCPSSTSPTLLNAYTDRSRTSTLQGFHSRSVISSMVGKRWSPFLLFYVSRETSWRECCTFRTHTNSSLRTSGSVCETEEGGVWETWWVEKDHPTGKRCREGCSRTDLGCYCTTVSVGGIIWGMGRCYAAVEGEKTMMHDTQHGM